MVGTIVDGAPVASSDEVGLRVVGLNVVGLFVGFELGGGVGVGLLPPPSSFVGVVGATGELVGLLVMTGDVVGLFTGVEDIVGDAVIGESVGC